MNTASRRPGHVRKGGHEEALPTHSDCVSDVAVQAEVAEAVARERSIALAAYYRAERRGFCPGCELEDWLAAEREVDNQSGGP